MCMYASVPLLLLFELRLARFRPGFLAFQKTFRLNWKHGLSPVEVNKVVVLRFRSLENSVSIYQFILIVSAVSVCFRLSSPYSPSRASPVSNHLVFYLNPCPPLFASWAGLSFFKVSSWFVTCWVGFKWLNECVGLWISLPTWTAFFQQVCE